MLISEDLGALGAAHIWLAQVAVRTLMQDKCTDAVNAAKVREACTAQGPEQGLLACRCKPNTPDTYALLLDMDVVDTRRSETSRQGGWQLIIGPCTACKLRMC